MPMVFTDAKAIGNPIIFANDSLLAPTGYNREELLAKEFHFLLARDADAETLAGVERASRRCAASRIAVLVLRWKDAHKIDLRANAKTHRD